MTPDLEDLLRQLVRIKAEGPAVCAGLTESQFNWRPGPKRWSIAECLVHLNVAVTRTVPADAAHALPRVLPEFLTVRDQLGERVRRADGLDLKRIRVVSPVTRLLRLPLGAYFQFVIAHDRRHLWQARQVRNAPGFGLAS